MLSPQEAEEAGTRGQRLETLGAHPVWTGIRFMQPVFLLPFWILNRVHYGRFKRSPSLKSWSGCFWTGASLFHASFKDQPFGNQNSGIHLAFSTEKEESMRMTQNKT